MTVCTAPDGDFGLIEGKFVLGNTVVFGFDRESKGHRGFLLNAAEHNLRSFEVERYDKAQRQTKLSLGFEKRR